MSQKNKSIQEKMTELNQLVEWFQGDDFALERAIETYQKAEALAKEIEADLMALKNEITVVKQRFDTEG